MTPDLTSSPRGCDVITPQLCVVIPSPSSRVSFLGRLAAKEAAGLRTFCWRGDTLTDQGFGQGQPDDATRAADGPPGQPQYGPGVGQGAGYPRHGATGYPPPSQQLSDTKGFVASLFDFGFTSFVTTKVVKVLYVLIMVLLALSTLGFVISAFAVKPVLGIFVLLIVGPILFFVYLAVWRIFLEILIIIFRIAEDLRAIRERGGFR
jgi:hypothetical protein